MAEVIAEIAQGYEGNSKQASLLILAASKANCDAVKFQLVFADELATPDYKYYSLFKSLEMNDEDWKTLVSYSKGLGIKLYLDIFGYQSLKLAEELQISGIKLHGTDIANLALLNAVAKSSIQLIILGAGGAYLDEIQTALKILKQKNVVIMLGFQGYPTPIETNQISRVSAVLFQFKTQYPNLQVGFADHENPESPLRYAVAATAIGNGATIVEKHLTLGRNMALEDFESALNSDEMHEFVQIVKKCSLALGSKQDENDFGMSIQEKDYRNLIRRHVVAGKDLPLGRTINASDVVLKRTSSINPILDLNLIYNKTLINKVLANNPITLNDFKEN